jgi:uncharacterized protein YaaW (UPF0174 family)
MSLDEKLIKTDTDLLAVLEKATEEDLAPIVEYLTGTKDKNGTRLTCELDMEKIYVDNHPNHTKYINEIAAEIQLFGGNTWANIPRGRGVPYSEIVMDVASKLKVKYDIKTDTVSEIEQKVLSSIFEKAYEKMEPKEQEEFWKVMMEGMTELEKRKMKGFANIDTNNIPFSIPLIAFQTAIKSSGFLAYQTAVIVANAASKALLGRGLSVATNAGLSKIIGMFTGPIGWVITGLWTLADLIKLAGPAYRVTVPCVLHIAYLRAKQQQAILDKQRKMRRLVWGISIFCATALVATVIYFVLKR